MKQIIIWVLANPFIWIFMVGIFAFWQVAFLYSVLHWDMLDIHLPWLYYLSEVLQSGELHYWNPYQQLGYPFHADMMSTWYPPALLTARFIGFNLYTLHYYFLMHVIVAGCGMFKLCGFLGNEKRLAFAGAVAYMLCGMVVSNAQHLFIITSLTWLPFIVYYFLKIPTSLKFFDALKLSVVACFMITGGYPFITVITFYLLVILSGITFFENFNNDKKNIAKILWLYLSGLVLTLLLSAPMITSFIQVFPVLERGTPLSVEAALSFPYTLHALWFTFIPFALANNAEFFGTDISMINIYFGIIFLIFFLYNTNKKATLFEYLFLFFGIFCLLASLSVDFHLMRWLVAHIPLFNYFRFPALFRLFFILGSIIFSLGGLRKFLLRFDSDKKNILFCASPFVIIILFAIIYTIPHIDIYHLLQLKATHSLRELLMSLTFYERVLFGGIIQLIIVSAFLIIVWKTKNKFSFLRNIIFLAVIDLLISVQMNINYTVVDSSVDPIQTERSLEAIIPKGFPIPNRKSMLNAHNEQTSVRGIWRNINIFSKEPAIDGFSSFWLNDYILLENDTLLKKYILDNSPVYLSSQVFSMNDLSLHKQNQQLDRKNIYLLQKNYEKIKSIPMEHQQADTAIFLQFGPNRFRIKVNSSGTQMLTLMQSNYTGWNVKVNNVKAAWMKSNYLFMSVLILKGVSEVEFYYENKEVRNSFFAAVITFFCVLMGILFLAIKDSNKLIDN